MSTERHTDTAPVPPVSARFAPDVFARIEAEAARREWSRSQTINRAVEIGLAHLEALHVEAVAS